MKKINVTLYATLIVDDQNDIVQEYESMQELVADIASYKPTPPLPVVTGGGVKIDEFFLGDFEEVDDDE